MRRTYYLLFGVVVFLAGYWGYAFENVARAGAGNPNYVHMCVKNSTGEVKIVAAGELCPNNYSSFELPLGKPDLIPYLTDLRGADFSRMDLRYRDLSNTDLTGINLSAAVLEHSDLTGANLSHADMKQAAFGEAIISNVDLSYADLSFADLQNAQGMPISLDHAIFNNTYCPDSTNSHDLDNNGTCLGHFLP